MKNRKKQWVVVLPDGRYLLSSRGEKTEKLEDACGWHYKKDANLYAQDIRGAKVLRRGQVVQP